MNDFERKLEGLTPAQRRLLEQRLRQRRGAGAPLQTIPRLPDESPFPLSAGQAGQWFLQRLEPAAPHFNVVALMRLEGPFNQDAFEQALTTLVERHEILRTVFVDTAAGPRQVIQPAGRQTLPTTDLRHLVPEERQAALEAGVRQEAQRPFDLAGDVMLRYHLFQLGEQSHVLLRNTHHAASDKWSAGILDGELSRLYDAYYRREPLPDLPPLPVRYADFSAWQQAWLQSAEAVRDLAYWRAKLEDAPTSLALPTDFPRRQDGAHRGSTLHARLEPDLVERLRAFSRQQGVTLFMTLLATFKVLLHRWSEETDIIVGAPVAGRSFEETQNVVGMFINTLVLRSRLDGNPSFRELLQQVRQTTLGALAHQQMPFEKLVEELSPERRPGRTPYFQVMFDYMVTPSHRLELADITITHDRFDLRTAAYDVTLFVADQGKGLHLSLEYSADLFTAKTIDRLARQYQVLLRAVVADADRPVGALPLLADEERQQLLSWNDTVAVVEKQGLHQMVEATARRTPRAPSIIWRDGRLSYEQLNAQANHLAHRLQQEGVAPGSIVAVCLDRSPALLISLLAILKAGAAFLPLDPAAPNSRLRDLLADAGAAALITVGDLWPADRPFDGAVIPFNGSTLDPADVPPANPVWTGTPADPAYIIYTSGSTGRSKGVVVAHEAAVNFVTFAARAYQLTPEDRVLQFAAITFDTAIEEIFPAWHSSAAVVIEPALLDGGLEQFIAHVRRLEVTVLDLPTAFWHAWVAELDRHPPPPTVRLVIVGGEEADAAIYEAWRARVDPKTVAWINTYGPTETTVVALTWQPPLQGNPPRRLPIGRPIANTRAYVVDPYGNELSVGIPGELWLAGAGLACGYLNRQEEEAARFLNPGQHHLAETGRIYRTGDRVKRLGSGDLLFLGRSDEQLKLRGFRIEPAEIRAALLAIPGLAEAAVLAVGGNEDSHGDRHLVAFVVPRESHVVDPTTLRDRLSEKLPAYMVPTRFIAVAALPLTRHGKLNQAALLEAAQQKIRSDPQTAPQTPLEKVIAVAWRDLLAIDAIGRHDDFFALGGHSLLSMRLIGRLSDLLRTPIPLRTIFEAPTIAGLAATLTAGDQSARLERIAALYLQVAGMSDDEAARRLAERRANRGS